MNTAAIYHRTESEYAYLYTNELMHVRLRTARADCKNVSLVHGDPYELEKKRWYKQPSAMRKTLSTDLYDYWEVDVTAPYHRLSYGFIVTGYDETTVFFTEHGVFRLKKTIY